MWKQQLRWTLPLLLLLAAGAWWVLPRWVPLPEALLTPRQPSTQFLSRDGLPLRTLLTGEGDRLYPQVPLKDIPRSLVYATLAAEDKRFGQHQGLDLLAILRSGRDNIQEGRVVSGASTIHQQLIKVTSGTMGKRTLKVKAYEALQARRLAMEWDRKKVLTEYLHRISYGNLLTGCAAAASGYFNKPLTDLTDAECAFLAAIPQSPKRFNPLKNPDAIKPRQQRILHKMRELKWLSEEQLQAALAQPIKVQRYTGGFAAPHAVELLRQGETVEDGDIVRTSLQSPLQHAVEEIIGMRLAELRSRHVTQAAAVVMDNATGHVLALAGSRDFFATDGGQINGAWAPRSPGSALKPFTYVLAFERGASPASIVADLPVEYPTQSGLYRPANYANRVYGPVTYRDALGNSLNIATVKVLASIGGPETLLAKFRELGITTLTETADHYGLGLTIGNAPFRLIELTNAYACLARLGLDLPWSLRPRRETPAATRRLGERECYLIADILNDNQARLLTFGAHSPLRLPFPAAVKTGTSQSYRDNWTLGYTPEYTVGVWAGNFDNTPMQEVSGVSGAAPIWRDILLHLHEKKPLTWYSPPAGVVRRRIDPRTGKLLTPQSPAVRQSREEWFLEDRLPAAASADDYDAQGRALLPNEYATWIRSGDNWMGDLVTVRDADAHDDWNISNPVAGTVVQLDPDVPNHGASLLLQTTPARRVEWGSATLEIRKDGDATVLTLEPGRHDITARDVETGEIKKTFVIVREE